MIRTATTTGPAQSTISHDEDEQLHKNAILPQNMLLLMDRATNMADDDDDDASSSNKAMTNTIHRHDDETLGISTRPLRTQPGTTAAPSSRDDDDGNAISTTTTTTTTISEEMSSSSDVTFSYCDALDGFIQSSMPDLLSTLGMEDEPSSSRQRRRRREQSDNNNNNNDSRQHHYYKSPNDGEERRPSRGGRRKLIIVLGQPCDKPRIGSTLLQDMFRRLDRSVRYDQDQMSFIVLNELFSPRHGEVYRYKEIVVHLWKYCSRRFEPSASITDEDDGDDDKNNGISISSTNQETLTSPKHRRKADRLFIKYMANWTEWIQGQLAIPANSSLRVVDNVTCSPDFLAALTAAAPLGDGTTMTTTTTTREPVHNDDGNATTALSSYSTLRRTWCQYYRERYTNPKQFLQFIRDIPTPTPDHRGYVVVKLFHRHGNLLQVNHSHQHYSTNQSNNTKSPTDYLQTILDAWLLEENGDSIISRDVSDITVLVQWRRNILEQYLSSRIARKRQKWFHIQTTETDRYNIPHDDFKDYVDGHVHAYRAFGRSLSDRNMSYEVIEFSDDLSDAKRQTRTMERILYRLLSARRKNGLDVNATMAQMMKRFMAQTPFISRQAKVPVEKLTSNWDEVQSWGILPEKPYEWNDFLP